MSRFVKILLIFPVLYLLAMPAYYAMSLYSKPCSGVVVSIDDSADYHFVTRRQLLNIVYANGTRVIGRKIGDLPVSSIEKRLSALHELKDVEVYTTIDGSLHVFADQRIPIMRVMPGDGGDYFVDEDGYVFRRRNLYTPRLHIVEGNVTITGGMLDSLSVLDTAVKHSVLKDMFPFINYINDDSFWSAQIDQIYVDGNDEIDLIPRVGNHVVHLGTFENFKGKLRNLQAFYEKVLPEVGWNKYSVINLEFRDQVVCKKRL